MYSFVRAVCLSRSAGSQWEETDISNYVVGSIFSSYSQIYLELSNVVLTDNVFVDFNQLRDEFSLSTLSLNNLLIDLGSRALDTVTALPTTDVKYVKYSDAFRAEYKINPCKIGTITPPGYLSKNMNDLRVSRPKYNTDLSKLHTHCLLSVNGYFHWTEADVNYAYIKDGAVTQRKSNHNQVGILSFLDVGELKKIKLTDTDISGYSTEPLRNRIYLNINEDLTNKSVILVLGGYLVFPQKDVFWQSGDHTLNLDINRLPYVERIYESSMYLDLQHLNLPIHTINPEMLNVNNLKTDDVIRKYLTLSQSYIVVVDKPRLSLNKIHLKHCSIPGQFTTYQDPSYPLIVNYGKMAEYWKIEKDGIYEVTIQDGHMRNYILTEQAEYYLENVNNHLVPNHPYTVSRGFLLEIAGYNL